MIRASASPAEIFSAEPESDFSDDERVVLNVLYATRDELYAVRGTVGLQVRHALEQLINAVAAGSNKITVRS